MPTSEDPEFHVDLTLSGQDRGNTLLIASIVAVAAIAFIILTMTTGLSARLLPMSDEYLQVLVPVAADGAEPLGLKSLDHQISGNTITVRGTVQNRTDYTVSGILAVVEMQDTTGRFAQTV